MKSLWFKFGNDIASKVLFLEVEWLFSAGLCSEMTDLQLLKSWPFKASIKRQTASESGNSLFSLTPLENQANDIEICIHFYIRPRIIQISCEAMTKLWRKFRTNNHHCLLSCSWHQTTKPRILFLQFFPQNFLYFSS